MKILTVLITNYNTTSFLETSLRAIDKLTISEYQVLINDNGSDQVNLDMLKELEDRYPEVTVFYRQSKKTGSAAHGEALDFLMEQSDTKYTAILDSDCTPLMAGWDQYLISQIDQKVKIVGSPLGSGWAGTKTTEFPFQFLVLLETKIYKDLDISASPRDISAGEDTCWEWEPKYLASGYSCKIFRSVNTRFGTKGPFVDVVCAEYYIPDGRIIGSHFGRGTNPSGKRPRSSGVLIRIVSKFFNYRAIQWRRDKALWQQICAKIIDEVEPNKKNSETKNSLC